MSRNDLKTAVQESEVLKLAKALPANKNTLIPFEWLEQSSVHYQAHLEKLFAFWPWA